MKRYETEETSLLVCIIICAGFLLTRWLVWRMDSRSNAALLLAAELVILAAVLMAVTCLIRRLPRIDEMTGMLSKTASGRQIEQILWECRSDQYVFFMIDIDNFKQANDKFGHAFGDEIIKDFASTIRGQFRQGDLLGRIGGDEFVAFVCDRNREWAEKKAGHLVKALHKTYRQGGKEWKLSASIGVAVGPGHGNDYSRFYKNADKALYMTKRNGKNGFTVYKDE